MKRGLSWQSSRSFSIDGSEYGAKPDNLLTVHSNGHNDVSKIFLLIALTVHQTRIVGIQQELRQYNARHPPKRDLTVSRERILLIISLSRMCHRRFRMKNPANAVTNVVIEKGGGVRGNQD